MKIRFGRRYHFFAAHRLHSKALSDDQNRQTYGKCNNPNGHGHTYQLSVLVEGPMNPTTSMVIQLPEMDSIVQSAIAQLSHKFLDTDLDYFSDRPSTSENIIAWFWQTLSPQFEQCGVKIANLGLSETRNNSFEMHPC